MQVYLDLVVLLNFLVDFLLLTGTDRFLGFPPDWRKSFLASALGGIYAGVCMLPEFRFLGNLLWRVVCLAGMAVIAFGWNSAAVRRGGTFAMLSMTLGGLALSLGRSDFPGILLAATVMWLLCRLSFGSGADRQRHVPVQLNYDGRRMNILALYDTGNTLRDPITGEQVLVVSARIGEKLLGLTASQFRNPLDTLAQRPIPGLRLIPYTAVGQCGGMLLALRLEEVTVGTRSGSKVVAFAPEGIGKECPYQALTGGIL